MSASAVVSSIDFGSCVCIVAISTHWSYCERRRIENKMNAATYQKAYHVITRLHRGRGGLGGPTDEAIPPDRSTVRLHKESRTSGIGSYHPFSDANVQQ